MSLETEQIKNAKALAQMIIEKGEPHKNSSTRVLALSSERLGIHSEHFTHILNELTAQVTKSPKEEDIKTHRECLKHILNTLVLCIFRFEWVALPVNDKQFLKGQYLQKIGFSRKRMQRCIDVLLENEYMFLGRKGFASGTTHGTRGKASQYFPTPKLINQTCEMLYQQRGDFDNLSDNYLYRFKSFASKDIPPFTEYSSQLKIIRDYNHFMREHSWAMKSPSYRTIKDFVGRSGRISNMYQHIAQRRIPIRRSTLLDGHKIAEPDFSANHLRMAAFILGEDLPSDPYEEVSRSTGLTRDLIKAVATSCMGALELKQKGGMIHTAYENKKVDMDSDSFRSALNKFYEIYPWLDGVFFHDFGVRLQYLEGEIALAMMRWSVDNQIPLIAVHDAFAVREIDKDVTEEHMKLMWENTLTEARANNFIENTKYTTALVIERRRAKRRAQ